MSTTTNSRPYIIPFAIVLLAAAIAYFSYALIQFSRQLPATTKTVAKVSDAIPTLLNEVDKTRAQLPAIYQRIDKLQAQLDTMQTDLPKILQATEDLVAVIHNTNQNVSEALPVLSTVASEISQTRANINDYLDHVDQIMAEAKKASTKAGEGAVKGAVKEIITSPWELLVGTEHMIRARFQHGDKMTHHDITLAKDVSRKILKSSKDTHETWANSKSGNSGEVTLKETFEHNGESCKNLQFTLKTPDNKADTTYQSFCRDKKGRWHLLKSG